MDFELDALDKRRARAEARARLFARRSPVTVGRYVLEARLGAGSWGVVYRACDPLMARTVALKVLHGEATALWRREAQLLAKLDHPHITDVFDVGVDEGRAYLVTRLIPGARTLSAWLAEQRPAISVLLRGFIDLADALAAVHAVGVLHRDIKPDNILVDHAGNVRLVDFGLAREHDDEVLGFEGTPAFVPPEVLRGTPPDAATDVYGLCASLWFGVCGTAPPRGTPPRRMQRLFAKGLATDPALRFRSAHHLGDQLRAALRPPTPWARFATTIAVGVAASLATLAPLSSASERHSSIAEIRDAELDDQLAEIAMLHAAERFTDAAALATSALRSAEGRRARASLELALGRTRYAQGAYADAGSLLESGFFQASSSDLADVASEAALLRFEVALETADLHATDAWQREAQAWQARRSASVPPIALRLALAESKRHALHGRLDDALVALPATPSSEDPRTQIAFWLLRGKVLDQLGRIEDGHAAFRAAEAVAQANLPAGHQLRRDAQWDLAVSFFHRGEYARSAEAFEALLEATLALDDPPPGDVAELTRNLGALHLQLGHVERALAYTRDALEANTTAFGPTHARTIDTLDNLAVMLRADGRDAAARETSWSALVASEAAYGAEHPRLVSTLTNLAVLESDAGDNSTAAALLRRGEDILTAHGRSDSLEMAGIQDNLSLVLTRLGQPRAAREAAVHAIATFESLRGPQSAELAEPLLHLVHLDIADRLFDDARQHATRIRSLRGVQAFRRARAAFYLAQLEALRQPPASPKHWLTTAAAELEQSAERPDSPFSEQLRRWQADWRAQRRALLSER